MITTYYNTKILDCYKLKRNEIKNTVAEVIRDRLKKDFPVNRTNTSYEKEIKAHILLYKLHLFRKHTQDCDLEEHIKMWKNIFYYMIGW